MAVSDIVDSVKREGYAVVESVLDGEACARYKAMLERDYRRYSPHYAGSQHTDHSLNDKSQEKVVYNMHNKDIDYFDLFDHPRVLPAVAALLQEGSYNDAEAFNLLNISARCPRRGSGGQQLHLDSNLPGRDSYPLIVVALFMLDDFSRDSGATRIVPGSHRAAGYAENGRHYAAEVIVEAPQGSVLIFNGALWHGGSAKRNDADRWAVILGYGRWFIKPSFDFSANMPAAIYDQLSDARKALLGFDCCPPKDEFTRITRRSSACERPQAYRLPL